MDPIMWFKGFQTDLVLGLPIEFQPPSSVTVRGLKSKALVLSISSNPRSLLTWILDPLATGDCRMPDQTASTEISACFFKGM